jgi:glucose 1-dehydrogenase
MLKPLTDKVALVTGAARGIGQGIALCLAEEGAAVVVNDLPLQSGSEVWDAQETAQTIRSLGGQALVYYADVSQRAQVEAMMAATVAEFGHLDIVVANAAFTIRELSIEAHWENVYRTLEVTQFGVYHTCQLAAKQMVAQIQQGRPGGKIIIIGSVRAVAPMITSAPYDMAKAAVNQFARTLAAELAEYQINVNAINPGWIDTPGEHKLFSPDQIQAGAKRIPWGRLGTPHEIGRTAVFLASTDADYITGTAVYVDGGFLLGLRDG